LYFQCLLHLNFKDKHPANAHIAVYSAWYRHLSLITLLLFTYKCKTLSVAGTPRPSNDRQECTKYIPRWMSYFTAQKNLMFCPTLNPLSSNIDASL
jgi:hypothetical protein